MSHVTNLAFFRARRGHSEALGTAVAALVEPTRLEAGCLNYCHAVLKSRNMPGLVVLLHLNPGICRDVCTQKPE
jgi:quinol monooxygenase YgiN